MNGAEYDIPAIPDKELVFMIRQEAHERRQVEHRRQQENACPVCGNKAGPRHGSERYKELIECSCGSIY
jgi:DNA repair exonuclease SbcCD ATPase subunit